MRSRARHWSLARVPSNRSHSNHGTYRNRAIDACYEQQTLLLAEHEIGAGRRQRELMHLGVEIELTRCDNLPPDAARNDDRCRWWSHCTDWNYACMVAALHRDLRQAEPVGSGQQAAARERASRGTAECLFATNAISPRIDLAWRQFSLHIVASLSISLALALAECRTVLIGTFLWYNPKIDRRYQRCLERQYHSLTLSISLTHVKTRRPEASMIALVVSRNSRFSARSGTALNSSSTLLSSSLRFRRRLARRISSTADDHVAS